MSHQFKPYEKVLVRNNNNDCWCADFFSHYETDNNNIKWVMLVSGLCCSTDIVVIPYNGNEHLIGTTNSPSQPEQEFKWGDHVEVLDNHDEWRKAIYLWQSTCRGHIVLLDDKATVVPYSFSICRHSNW